MKHLDRIFKVNDKVEIGCESVGTRYGFRHDAWLFVNGEQVGDKAKCCYYNRTWESFEFETVVKKLLEKTTYLTPEQKAEFLKNFTWEKTRSGSSLF